MSFDTKAEDALYRAEAALSCLEHLACYYDEKGEATHTSDFGYGLSVILCYIKNDVTSACFVLNEGTKKTSKPAAGE